MPLNPGKTARYFGGPLDGQTVERKTAAGTWAIYRDDDGTKITVAVGDREWIRAEPATRYYARQLEWVQEGHRNVPRVVYVHATAWNRWQEEMRTGHE